MSCYGGGTSNCYKCFYPYKQSGNRCEANCYVGYGITTNEGICVKCNQTCIKCAYT